MERDDDLTPEELAYFESGGKTELPGSPASTAEPADGSSEQKPGSVETKAEGAAGDQKNTPAESGDDEDGSEVIEIKDGRARGRDGKFVSHKALHAERLKRKQFQQENEELRVKLARGEERLSILNEAFNGGNTEPKKADAKAGEVNPVDEEDIDPLTDFMGAFDQMKRRNAWMQKQLRLSESRTQERDAQAVLHQTYKNDVTAFRQTAPDFMDAYQYLLGGRLEELKLSGVQDPAQRKKMVQDEEMSLVANALRNKQSPAQVIYGFAKARGYTSKAVPTNGGAAEKIRHLQKGQAAAETLSNVGGQAAPTLTYATLADMSQDDFNAAVDNMTARELQRMLGG